jgi:hypothetical protein
MKAYIGVLSVFLLAALVATIQGMAARDHVKADSAASVETNSTGPSAWKVGDFSREKGYSVPNS